jgi:hypothetical protein
LQSKSFEECVSYCFLTKEELDKKLGEIFWEGGW